MDLLEVKATFGVDDTGTITGTAWPFGTPDRVGDMIEKGAFRFPSSLPILAEHDQRQVVGVWESAEETDAGLVVKGRLFVEGVEPARKARESIRRGTIGGLSISFKHDGGERLPSGGRRFRAVDVTEISICRQPVHPGARITEMKSEPHTDQETHMEPAVQNEQEAIDDNAELKAFGDNIVKLTARLEKVETRLSRPNLANDNRNEPSLERKAFGSILRGVEYHRLPDIEQKALTVSSDAAAGYVLAPEDMTREFIRNLVEYSPIRAYADVRSTVSHTVTIPKRLTITNAAWTGEGATTTGTEPTFGEISLPIRELTTHVDIGNWLLEDALENVEAEVRLALAEDFGKKEATAFVNGTGALQPEGFMTNADIATTLNGHATNLSADQLITLMYALPAAYRNRGTWALNSTTLAAIRKLKNTAGDYLWQPALSAGQPETILGRPVVEMVDMGDPIANAFPVVFGDFKAAYRIYDRIALDVKTNPYLLATEGKVRFHARRRVGAAVVRPEALRKLKMAVS